MEKQKITFIKRTPRTSKTGKPFISLSIKTDRHGDKFLGGFGNKDNELWNLGDEIEIEVKQNGEYLNFETPKKGEAQVQAVKKELNEKMEEVLTKLGWIKNYLETNLPRRTSDGKLVPFQEKSVVVEYPEDEIDPDSIPF